ncbi:hypothetical protein NC651_001826 [Populus alba x Populus x berolinensis]|nr:hypothetical protein NC651_001826 [Populus alba x Populus x berolinensis]
MKALVLRIPTSSKTATASPMSCGHMETQILEKI